MQVFPRIWVIFLLKRFPHGAGKINFVKPTKTPITMKQYLVTLVIVVVALVVYDKLVKKMLKIA